MNLRALLQNMAMKVLAGSHKIRDMDQLVFKIPATQCFTFSSFDPLRDALGACSTPHARPTELAQDSVHVSGHDAQC